MIIYSKESLQIFVQTQEALANPSLIRVEDIKRLASKTLMKGAFSVVHQIVLN